MHLELRQISWWRKHLKQHQQSQKYLEKDSNQKAHRKILLRH